MPNRQKLVNAAKAILARIKGRDVQVFDVQTQSVHNIDEIKALKAALRHFIDHCDRNFTVMQVIDAGKLSIEPGDSPESILQEAANAMDSNDSTQIIGGDILFKATDGRWYTVVIESHIALADAKMVKELTAPAVRDKKRQ